MSVGEIVSLAIAVLCAFAGVAKLLMIQFEKRLDERFSAQEEARKEGRASYEARLAAVEKDHRELHTVFLRHLAELPRDYMRREDHIRFETVINAKLDALAAKQDLLAERLLQKGAA